MIPGKTTMKNTLWHAINWRQCSPLPLYCQISNQYLLKLDCSILRPIGIRGLFWKVDLGFNNNNNIALIALCHASTNTLWTRSASFSKVSHHRNCEASGEICGVSARGKTGPVRDDDEFLMTACPGSGSGIRGEARRGEGTDLIMDHDPG